MLIRYLFHFIRFLIFLFHFFIYHVLIVFQVLPQFAYQLFQEHLLLFVEYSFLIFIRLDNAQKLLRFLHVLLDFFIIGLLIALSCVLQ